MNKPNRYRQLLTGAILRFGMLIVGAAIGFFVTPFMIHQLGDKLFGIWTLVASFSGSYALLELGLVRAVGRYVAMHIGDDDYDSVNKYVNTALVIYCIMGVVTLVVAGGLTLFACSIVEDPQDVSLLKLLIIIVATEFAVSLPMRALKGTISANLRHDVATLIQLAFKLASSALIVIAILAGGKLITLALIGLTLGIVRGFVWYAAVRTVVPKVKVSPSLADRTAAGSLFSFSAFVFVAQIADVLRFQVDNLVIGGILGPKPITHYVVAITLTSHFMMATTSVVGVLNPIFAQQHGKNDMDALRKTLKFGARVAVFVVAFMAFGLVAWGKPFIERWMGPQYLDAYPCLVVITAGLTIALSQTAAISVFYGRAKHRTYAAFNVLEAIGNLGCSIVLVKYWGILGVAMGTAIPMILVKSTLQPWLVCKVLEIRLWEYYALLIRALLLAAISLAVPAIVTRFVIAPNYLSMVATGILCAAAYFPIAFLLIFSKAERQTVIDAIKKKRSQNRN